MSIDNIQHIATRIADAAEHSPIAVFSNYGKSHGKGKLDACFYNLVHTRARIRAKNSGLIGVFHKNSDKKQVHKTLRQFSR